MARILLVGTATLDMVFALDRHPAADDEIRADGLRICRGGNAANSAVVLAQLGHECNFFGVLADAPETAVIEQDFAQHGVGFSDCPRLPGRPPISSIYLSGNHRTIVHYRDLPEVTARQFGRIDLEPYGWVHFEGRNVAQLLPMLAHVRSARPQVAISLELEKPRDGIDAAWGMADFLICSRGYAMHHGYDDPVEFLGWMREKSPRSVAVVAWGESGAYALTATGDAMHAPALLQERVIDTLGAGDTFNAGLIGSLAVGRELLDAMREACRLAGIKCGQHGLKVGAAQ